jgi:hypothetical protein
MPENACEKIREHILVREHILHSVEGQRRRTCQNVFLHKGSSCNCVCMCVYVCVCESVSESVCVGVCVYECVRV